MNCKNKSKLFLLPLLILFLTAAIFATGKKTNISHIDLVSQETEIEYAYLQKQIEFYEKNDMPPALIEQSLNNQALIHKSDRDPLDILLRRTNALLSHLQNLNGAPDVQKQARALAMLKNKADNISPKDTSLRKGLFSQLISLRRQIAFKNPLLDFDSLIFLTHHKARYDHMCDQYFGFHANPGGGLYVIDDLFSDTPHVRNILENATVGNGRLKGKPLQDGSFISLELDYDAETIYFAWTEALEADAPYAGDTGGKWTCQDLFDERGVLSYWNLQSTYHIFKINRDGTGLTQLTDGPWNDFDPCVLPNGRLVFNSERRGGYLRCGARPDPTYTLQAMMPDGSDIIPLSYHETHEWHPSVANDGRIVYTRWDYVDRDSDIAHHIWFCYPDGRDPRSSHGNYPEKRESRPWMEMSIRAIPGSQKFVAVSTPHHGQAYGSMVLLDQQLEEDGAMSQIKRITPDAFFPEAEMAPGVPHPKGKHSPLGEVYGTPWPLSEDFYICVYDPEQKNHGLTLLDSFGNRILLYRDEAVPCLDPIPLAQRKRPPVIPSQTTEALADRRPGSDDSTATISVMNVYDADQPWPEGTEIKALRIVQLFPKTTRQAAIPKIGAGDQSLARGVLGTVPVEDDGSAYFEAPAGLPIYFQALDEKGMAVHTMRSLTYVHRGEKLTCQGCHEDKNRSVANQVKAMPKALKRTVSKIQPDVEGSWPLSFARLVQPVIDKKCAGCHAENIKAPKLITDLDEYGWTQAYHSLAPYAWYKIGGNGAIATNETSYSIPGQVGAQASKLYHILNEEHHDLKLSEEEMYRFTLWLDCNSTFYGAYHNIAEQSRGERIVPFLY
jgi:hypothetical protein